MINIFAYSKKGCELAKKVQSLYSNSTVYSTEKFANSMGVEAFNTLGEKTEELFNKSEALIYIGATAIAVRSISPHLKSKLTDPAVICIDDNAKFVIPILSGHIGRANDIANFIADNLGSTAVITTATDINNRFSVDSWASKNGYTISDMTMAKNVSAEILENDVLFKSDFKVLGKLPNGLNERASSKTAIYTTFKAVQENDFTLYLYPKSIHIGIGCRRGVDSGVLESLVLNTLEKSNIDIRAVASISSVELKKDEKAILDFAEKYNISLKFYPAHILAEQEGDFASSAFVKSVLGVDNVCERAAFISSSKGEKLLGKMSHDNITIAIYKEDVKISFIAEDV